MHLTPIERLSLLNLYRILEIIDPTNRRRWNDAAEAMELGTPSLIAPLFDDLDLNPDPMPPVWRREDEKSQHLPLAFSGLSRQLDGSLNESEEQIDVR